MKNKNKPPATAGLLKKKCSSGSSGSASTMEDSLSSDDSVSVPPTARMMNDNKMAPQSQVPSCKNVARQVTMDIMDDDESVRVQTMEEVDQPVADKFFGGSPVIGIISQPRISSETEETEYVIAASYVKWVESAGARVMPIPWDATVEMAEAIFPQINGLLLIGGNSILPKVARVFWDLANQTNANGGFFPIWGTCLGFEYLLMLASGEDEFIMQGGYKSHNLSCPVDLVHDNPSELYAKPIIREIVTEQPVTMNNHEFGISPEHFEQHPRLVDCFRITSVNTDTLTNKRFVSTIESQQPHLYPYYGVQYHPEKNAYEYGTEEGTNTPFENINHSADAVYFSFHLASFFVSLARKNLIKGQHVYSCDTVRFPLVYRYQVGNGIKFTQYYVVPAVGEASAEQNGGVVRFVGKDYSWRLDEYLADHVGIFKTEYTEE